jgi:hypothetical protein
VNAGNSSFAIHALYELYSAAQSPSWYELTRYGLDAYGYVGAPS